VGFLVAVGDSAVAVLAAVDMAAVLMVAVDMAAVADADNEAISRCSIWRRSRFLRLFFHPLLHRLFRGDALFSGVFTDIFDLR
jgi:hypothetical protein